jgi:dsDNA-specific endonuclease/ATPase MutS2
LKEELQAHIRDVNELLQKTENLAESERSKALQNHFSALKEHLTILPTKIENKSILLKVMNIYVSNQYNAIHFLGTYFFSNQIFK